MPLSDFWYISLPHATFGLICEGGVIAEAAPIAKWATGKKEDYVLAYFRRKGARIIKGGSPNGRASALQAEDRGSTPLPPTKRREMMMAGNLKWIAFAAAVGASYAIPGFPLHSFFNPEVMTPGHRDALIAVLVITVIVYLIDWAASTSRLKRKLAQQAAQKTKRGRLTQRKSTGLTYRKPLVRTQ